MILKPQRNSLFALTMSYSSRIIETSDSSSFLIIFKFFSKPFISQLLICYYEVRIQESGAPNENIVQNHLNIALSNIFQYLNCSDPKIIGIKTSLFENFSHKKGSQKFQVTFLGQKSVKNGQLHPFWEVRKSYETHASKKFNNKCSENSRSQIVFLTDIFQKLSLGAPEAFKRL